MILIINEGLLIPDTPSRSAWEEDDDITPPKRSSWDLPTPSVYSGRSERGSESRRSDRSDRSHRGDSYKR